MLDPLVAGGVTSTDSGPLLSQIRNELSRCCSPCWPGERSGSPETNMPTHVQVGVVPVLLLHLAPRGVHPGEVLGAAVDRRGAVEVVALPQRGVLAAQPQRGLGDVVDVEPGVVGPPVDPGDLVVLDVGVVVAALGAAALVAGGDHRRAVRQAQRGHQVGRLRRRRAVDLGVVGLALDAEVPGAVVVGAVAVAARRWPRCAWCCRRPRRACVKPSWAVRKLTEAYGDRPSSAYRSEEPASRDGDVADAAGVGAPEVADGVAVAVVPLHPRRRERADPVAVHRGVPRLGDQLDVAAAPGPG